jgi:ferredoxin-type protein NapH
VLGKVSLLRVSFDAPTCTQCCECAHVCPEPQVFDFKKAHKEGMITSPECSNCGRCITVCPENTLKFDIRSQIIKQSNPEQQDQRKIV